MWRSSTTRREARTALVLDGGSAQALVALRSLGRAGWRVLTTAHTRAAVSRYAAGAVPIPTPETDPQGFVREVSAVLERERVDVVAPCTDASVQLLWAHEDVLGGARVLGASRASLEVATDKSVSLAAADAAGFGTPAWAVPTSIVDARRELERIGLPCVVKPRRSYVLEHGRLRQRRHSFVRDANELEAVLASQAEPDGSLPVLEAFVPGRSLSVTAVVRDRRVLALAAREALTFEPVAGGNSVWKRTIPPGDAGVQKAVQLLLSIGYEGLAEVEYQVDTAGRERLMEIGGRLHGWVGLAVAAGVDLPLIAARALLGDELDAAPSYRVGVEMRRLTGEVWRLHEALRSPGTLPPGMTTAAVVAGTWPLWRRGMRYDGIDLSDPLPMLPRRVREASRRSRVR